MRVAVLPDLHLGITSEESVVSLVAQLRAAEPAAVVLAGDLGEPLPRFEQALDLLVPLGCDVAVVAGNHDVWNKTLTLPSRTLWEERLPAAVRARGFVWLEADMLVRDGWALVGTIGWYDYSARSPEYAGKSEEAFYSTKGFYNNDGRFIDWPWTDVQFAHRVGEQFLQRVEAAESNPAVESVLAVTHMPLFPEQRVPVEKWSNRTDAYFGNWTLGRALESHTKVRALVSGHAHMGCQSFHVCPDGRKLYVATVDSDYYVPRYAVLDTEVLGQ
ncbi:MAG: metallophosphoesterase [Kiritimatiellae bacterium]|nr:metallophosphoesterase [Kiritimatiellia bacterium]